MARRKDRSVKNLDELKERNRKTLDFFDSKTKLKIGSLSKEMAENSALMYRIGVIKSDAELLMDRAKNKIELVRSQVDKLTRKKHKGAKKLTEAAIKERVANHSKVVASMDEYLEAKWKYNVCAVASYSIKEKGEQLRSMSFRRADEAKLGTQVRMMKDAEKKVKGYKKNG